MADTRPVPQPLSPGDRRLRAGRYEVLHHGPKGSGKGSDPSSRRALADTARFATERDARAFASSLTRVPGDLLVIDRVAPRSSRYAGCPWDRREVAVVPEPRPTPDLLSGCTCGGIGTTGAHAVGCAWGRQR